MSEIKKRFCNVQSKIHSINPRCEIIVVTKTKSSEILLELAEAGAKHIGENTMQGLSDKHFFATTNKLNFDFHLIAPIQTNKLKILNFPFHYHCLTELRHLKSMKEKNIVLKNCFIQVNISHDSAKSGIEPSQVELFAKEANKIHPITGLMTILKQNLTKSEILQFYKELVELAQKLKLHNTSMGMSSDYMEAAKAGASFVRIGTEIVGER